jgi:4-hydroxy-tetrahydrodipicolinate synthase
MFSMVVTPMDRQGRIDEEGTRAHLRRMIDAGVGVYLGSGGSGEGHALELDELARLYEIGVDECRGKVPVYCNPPESRSAAEMLRKSRAAISAGADLVQFYQLDSGHGRQPPLAEQEKYFRDLLEATDHPAGISVHLAVGYLAPSALVIKLCNDYPQVKIVNIPFGPDMNYLVRLQQGIRDDIKIYVGMHNILSGLAMGAWGAQVTETNQVPNLSQAIVDHYVAGDIPKAAEAYARVLRVCDVIGYGRAVSSDGPKAALKALGFDVGDPRPPRVAVDDATLARMKAEFEELGVLEWENEAANRPR